MKRLTTYGVLLGACAAALAVFSFGLRTSAMLGLAVRTITAVQSVAVEA